MKKVIKNRLFLVLFTSIICIIGSVYATTQYLASEIEYKDTTVESALNELYDTQTTTITDLQSQIDNYKNKDCVGGSYLKSVNSYINIDVGFTPSRFFVQFTLDNGNVHNVIYNSFYNSNSYDHYFKSDGTYSDTQVDVLSILNNKIVDNTGASTSNRYKNSYTVYYIACK